MVDLFLDIETAPDMSRDEYAEARRDAEAGRLTARSDRERHRRYTYGALDPFMGRVILITHRANGGVLHRLKEWELGERGILEKFYGQLDNLGRGGGDMLRIVGHNILGFDLPFLYHRMVRHGVGDPRGVFDRVLRPAALDFLQVHLHLNGFSAKGLKHDVLARAYGLPTKGTSGAGEVAHYFEGRYDEVLGYSEREFVYPEMLERIRAGGLATEEAIREAKRWHEGAAGAQG